MNDEKNFPEPEKLKPERWLRGCPGQHTAHPFAAIPLSFGPRMCVEWRCTLYMLATKVVQKFRLGYHNQPAGRMGLSNEIYIKKLKIRSGDRIHIYTCAECIYF